MSTKAIVWTVVVVIIALGAWYFLSGNKSSSATGTTQTDQTSQSAQQADPNALSSGTADGNLSADLNQLDTQTSAASDASASVDQGMNDQPVQQTE